MALPLLAVASKLAVFAPWLLGKLVGDNAEKVAEKVVNIAAAAAKEFAQPGEEPLQTIERSSEAAIAFQLAVMQNATELERLYFEDLKDARDRDVKIQTAAGGNARANWMFAAAFVLVIACLAIVVWNSDLDEYAKGILTLILGRFLTYLEQIYYFEFGTTRANRVKDDTINRLTKQPGDSNG